MRGSVGVDVGPTTTNWPGKICCCWRLLPRGNLQSEQPQSFTSSKEWCEKWEVRLQTGTTMRCWLLLLLLVRRAGIPRRNIAIVATASRCTHRSSSSNSTGSRTQQYKQECGRCLRAQYGAYDLDKSLIAYLLQAVAACFSLLYYKTHAVCLQIAFSATAQMGSGSVCSRFCFVLSFVFLFTDAVSLFAHLIIAYEVNLAICHICAEQKFRCMTCESVVQFVYDKCFSLARRHDGSVIVVAVDLIWRKYYKLLEN